MEPKLSNLEISESADGFQVSYEARCEGPEGSALGVQARITGTATELSFEAGALAQTDFLTCRCGFCILHPIEGVAGSDIIVEHVDGSVGQTGFPTLIDPWQPFKQMRAITHSVADGISCECRMEGDAFEMEDQRNWSDASYKTYVRPLELPWPYLLKRGEETRQRVRLKISDKRGNKAARAPATRTHVAITPGPRAGEMPGAGLVIAPEDLAAGLEQLDALTSIAPQRLLLHFDPLAGHGADALAGFTELRRRAGIPAVLELALPCRDDPEGELQGVASMVRQSGLGLAGLIVSPSVDRQSTPPGSKWPDCPPLENIYAAARRAFPDLSLGGGMLSYFTELNRKRVPSGQLDFITHATCPIVHAADDLSVMQTLEALPFITRSVRAIYGNKPYHIGPSTIAMRQNPYGGATKSNPDLSRIPMANRDPRHHGLFAAAWAVGYVARCIAAEPKMLTLSALAGDFGLIAGAGEPMPEGGMRPLFHVVKCLAGLSDWQWRECVSSDPGRLACMLAQGPGNQRTLIAANLTPDVLKADVALALDGRPASLAVLDESCVISASSGVIEARPLTGGNLTLGGFAVAFVRQGAAE